MEEINKINELSGNLRKRGHKLLISEMEKKVIPIDLMDIKRIIK